MNEVLLADVHMLVHLSKRNRSMVIFNVQHDFELYTR